MSNNNNQVNDGYDEIARPLFISPPLSPFPVLPILHSARSPQEKSGYIEKGLSFSSLSSYPTVIQYHSYHNNRGLLG